MMHPRFPILIGFLLLNMFLGKAQDNPYVYQDSALLSVEGSDTADPMDDDMERDYVADTALVNNGLQLSGDSTAALKRKKQFAYAQNLDSLLYQYQMNQLKKGKSEKENNSWLEAILLSSITKYFFWGLAGAFIGVILYNLFFTQGFFQRNYTRPAVSSISSDKTEKLSTSTNYDELVSKAVAAADYRMAVRYLYLQCLQQLMVKGAIDYAPDKTNHQYLKDLTGKTYRAAFADVTRNYEYVWYGEFAVTPEQFAFIQSRFSQLNKAVY